MPGVLQHLSDAWRRRREPNVLLVHYDDLLADLAGQMQHIAAWLGIEVPPARWPTLVEAATFTAMRRKATLPVPDPSGVLKDHRAVFRQGRSGAERDLLSNEEISRYRRRAADLAPPDLLAWLHRGGRHRSELNASPTLTRLARRPAFPSAYPPTWIVRSVTAAAVRRPTGGKSAHRTRDRGP